MLKLCHVPNPNHSCRNSSTGIGYASFMACPQTPSERKRREGMDWGRPWSVFSHAETTHLVLRGVDKELHWRRRSAKVEKSPGRKPLWCGPLLGWGAWGQNWGNCLAPLSASRRNTDSVITCPQPASSYPVDRLPWENLPVLCSIYEVSPPSLIDL